MKIMDFLCPDAISLNFEAQDKKEAITAMVAYCRRLQKN